MENSEVNRHSSLLLSFSELTPFDAEIDSGAGLCFLTKIENDIERIFVYLQNKFSTEDTYVNVKNIIKKGNIFQKGDFFLSLRSSRLFFLHGVKEELLDKLKAIPYINESVIDESGNLLLCLKRTVLFKNVLKDAMRGGINYGMKTSRESFLILVHNEVFNNFDALRIALVANHVISFLVTTGAKVSVNEFKKFTHLTFKEVPSYGCSDLCLQQIQLTSELIENATKNSGRNENKWISITDEGSVNIDLKKYAKFHSLSLEKDAEDMTIAEKMPSAIINVGAYTIHFNVCHAADPDHIIHICLQNEKRKIIESGLLIELLELIHAPQSFITCQNTHSKAEIEVTVDEYINHHKKDIDNAMKGKYSHDELMSGKWEVYLKNLLDTSMKFSFLRTGTHDPLKLDLTFKEKTCMKNKDGIFIQYNFARLSTILKKFEFQVEKGYYEQLPSIDEIDFSLLKFEEEWNLLNFVLCFPRLIQDIFLSLKKSFFPVNKVQIMLIELCHCFSKYYSRIHILGGSQSQLQRVMHARIWLLKGVYQILNNSFYLLNIEGLNKM